MTAAAEISGHLSHVHLLVGAQAHLVFHHPGLVHENGAVHPLYVQQLVHDAVQILGLHMIEFHGLALDDTHNAPSVHETDALHQRPSHDLRLYIGFLIKGLLHQPRKIEAVTDEPGPLLHSSRSGI